MTFFDLAAASRSNAGTDLLTMDVFEPATGEVARSFYLADAASVDRAVSAAAIAQREWGQTDWRDRAAALRRIAQSIRDNIAELAELEAIEVGKPVRMAETFDLQLAHRSFDYFADLLADFAGRTRIEGPIRIVTDHEPYGVVAGVLPFNWPPVHVAAKAAPALAAGNAIVLKPPEQAPSVVLRLVELIAAELPNGLISAVCGAADIAQALVTHPDVGLVSFTGSPVAGRAVATAAAAGLTPSLLELGGKNAFVVLEGADVERAVRGAIEGAYFNQGEACTAASRLIVHESLHDAFVEQLSDAVRRLVVGRPLEQSTHVGPLVSQKQRDRVEHYLRVAVEEGATIMAQASVPQDEELAGGYWVPPTLLAGVTPASTVGQEEIFGPIAAVIPFATEDEAVSIANGTDFALVAAVYGPELGAALAVAERIDAGIVFVNNYNRGILGTPFGGNRQSGYGREHSPETLSAYARSKSYRLPSGHGPIPEWIAVTEVAR